MTDGLEQYHKLARDQEGITNANCMAHARRHFANAIKAAGQKGRKSIQSSIAYQALVRIGAIYELEKGLKNLSAEECIFCGGGATQSPGIEPWNPLSRATRPMVGAMTRVVAPSRMI